MVSPPKSPDLNTIEWVWSDMKRFIRKFYCTNKEDIFQAIQEFHKLLTLEYCRKYIGKLKKVIKKVITLNGGWSHC